MIEIDVLKRNKRIFNPDPDSPKGYGIFDICLGSMNYSKSGLRLQYSYLIKEDDAMRPDLIAFRRLGSQGDVGSLLKTNGISNPFSVNPGDVIFIPKKESISSAFSPENLPKITGEEKETTRKEYRKAQESKKFKKSSARDKYLSNLKNRTPQALPPNALQEGEDPIVTKSGLIFFGPDTTSN